MVDCQARLRQVFRPLEQNSDHSIEMLASSACLSFYHFNRVFTGVAGETPGEMCRRLRNHRATWLLRYTDASNTDHSDVGGTSRLLGICQGISLLLWLHTGRVSSKNGHLISKDGHAIEQPNPYAEGTLSARNNTMKILEMNTGTLPTSV